MADNGPAGPGDRPPSERHVAALDLLLLLVGYGVAENNPPRRDHDGKCYKVDFGKTEKDYGTAYVYNVDYVRVWYKSEFLGGEGDDTFGSVEQAGAFVLFVWRDRDKAAAARVPRRQRKAPRNPAGGVTP